MLEVSRRTGRITSHHSAAHSTQVTTDETSSVRVRKLREMRHIASISGVWSRVMSTSAPSLCAWPMTRACEPGSVNSVPTAARVPAVIEGSSTSNVSRAGNWAPEPAASRRPFGKVTTMLFAPTLSRIFAASSAGCVSSAVSPNNSIALWATISRSRSQASR